MSLGIPHTITKFRERKIRRDIMEQMSLNAIKEWVRFLRKVEKINFAVLGKKDIMALIDITIRLDFLRATASY